MYGYDRIHVSAEIDVNKTNVCIGVLFFITYTFLRYFVDFKQKYAMTVMI